MKRAPFAVIMAGVVGALGAGSCLEKDAGTPAAAATGEDPGVRVRDLEAEVVALKGRLADAEAAKAAAEAALKRAEAATEQEQGVGEAAGGASAELAAARKELADLRAQASKSEAEHAARVADLQQQIKAMALKVPTDGGGGTVVQPGTRTPATGSGIERRIGSGQ